MVTEELARIGIESRPYLIRVYGVTEEEYDALTTEDTKYELIDGVLVMHSPASTPHERLFGFLSFILSGYVDERRLGEVLGSRATLHLATCRKLEPDLLFVATQNLGRVHRKEVEGTADLVVEILSDSTRDFDLDEKHGLYRQAGVPEIWFVDEERQELTVDTVRGSQYQESRYRRGRVDSATIMGFWLDVSWLWQDPLPGRLPCLLAVLGQEQGI